MYNENYWRDKQERKRLREESTPKGINKALAFLRGLFAVDEGPVVAGAGKKREQGKHTRSPKERRIRRMKHADMMRGHQ